MDRLLTYAGQQSVIRPRDLDKLHIPRNYLGRLVRAGKLEQVGRGLYSSSENPPTENRTVVEVCRKMPQAVVCLSSALRFHQLTTENPFEVWIALKQGAWTPRFKYPPIRVVRFSGPSLTLSAMGHMIEGVKIKVYSPAKTVAGLFQIPVEDWNGTSDSSSSGVFPREEGVDGRTLGSSEDLLGRQHHASVQGVPVLTKNVSNLAASIRQRPTNLARQRNENIRLLREFLARGRCMSVRECLGPQFFEASALMRAPHAERRTPWHLAARAVT